MIDISVRNLSMSYFAGPIFSEVSFEVMTGERVGLLGENGSGKSTILRIISGQETQSGGELSLRKGIQVGFLEQVPPVYPGATTKEVLMMAFSGLEEIEKEMRTLEEVMATGQVTDKDLTSYGHLQETYESLGGYEIHERYQKIVIGLSITPAMEVQPFETLSGGEKTRVTLGKLLLESPDVLLLDEPTNHLDLVMTTWLEEYLKTYQGAVVIVSHDRFFLDRVIHKIFELKYGAIEVFHGNYSYYLEERQARYDQLKRKYDAQQKKIRQMEEAVKRFEQWGKQSDDPRFFVKARNMEKRIEKMDKLDRPMLDTRGTALAFEAEDRTGKEVLIIKDAQLSMGDKVLLRGAKAKVFYQERIGLIGPNGCGKSTLIKALMGEDIAFEGTLKLGANVKVGYLQQDIVFYDEEMTILDALRYEHPMTEGQGRNYLARFKFYKEDVFKVLKTLSGGERVRLRLSMLMKEDINVLILDEPTNHIDIKTRELLEEALLSFNGTILFISHDRYLLNRVATSILAFEEGTLVKYTGNYNDYIEQVKKQATIAVSPKEKPKAPEVKVATRTQLNPQKTSLMERNLENLYGQLEGIEAALEREQDYQKLTDLLEEKKSLLDEIDRAETQLLEAMMA